MEKRVCVYCGKSFKGKTYMCSICANKLPLVKQLVAIGRKIKAGANK